MNAAVDMAKPPPRRVIVARRATPAVLPAWIRGQAINVTRHAAALRPFRASEFGTGPASPSEAHVGAANALISSLRQRLLGMTATVTKLAQQATAEPATAHLQALVRHKERAHGWVQAIER